MKFLNGITETRKAELLKQLRAIWTHDSTAIEGNTLTLGDTMFVLGYGLTIKGKPLKDQIDVQNHANAIDALLKMVDVGHLTEEDIFLLHRTVINEQSNDIYKPPIVPGGFAPNAEMMNLHFISTALAIECIHYAKILRLEGALEPSLQNLNPVTSWCVIPRFFQKHPV